MLICIILLLTSFVTNGENEFPSKESKIFGGSSISINEANYQISLRVKAIEVLQGFGSGHICGGSVIAQRTILTAAHCVDNYVAKDLTVVMGNANRFIPNRQQLQYNVQEILKHQNYNASTFTNDIALLFINGYIPWNWLTVQAVQLNTQQTAANSLCNISGWGKMENGKMSISLLAASVPIIPYQQCLSSYGFMPLSMICAGYMRQGGIDACQGDSGGPLVCNNRLTGVVSWGIGCAVPNRPGVYTNISAFHDWIVKTNSSFNYTLYGRASTLNLNIFLSIFLLVRLLYLMK